MNNQKSYFASSFFILLLSALFFLVAKEFLPKKIFSDYKTKTSNVLIDSMLIDAFDADKEILLNKIEDTLDNQTISFFETMGVTFPNENFTNYTGNQYLISFYEKLYQLETTKNGNVRIAYYGDSMTDGDYIVQDFRNCFQNKFGGHGVGFVSITSESAASRGSVKHEFSKNWTMQSYLNVKNPLRPFGINGHVFFANDTASLAWVKFQGGLAKSYKTLDQPTLFFGSSNNINGRINFVIGNDTLSKKLSPVNALNTLILTKNTIKAVKINFKNAKSIPVYGINFDDGKGVHIDNFSQRGMSGLPLSRYDQTTMKAFQKKLDYDLIIMHYGTNVLNYGTKNYAWYEKSMARSVRNLNKCFENVPILIHSTSDKSTKYDMEMRTDSAVVPLSLSQKRYALSTKSAFVNLYELMGGQNSMVKWAEEQPALANKDYTHLNIRGSKKMGELLFENFMKGYEKYKLLRNMRNIDAPKATALGSDSLSANTGVNE